LLRIEINGKKIEIDDKERQECEIWSRVVGYFRPVDAWNIGKQQEFKDRKYFDENKFVK